jgi:hypothetical protein
MGTARQSRKRSAISFQRSALDERKRHEILARRKETKNE